MSSTELSTTGVPFARALADHGDRIALLTPDGSLSYRELADRVGRMSARLGGGRRVVLVHGAPTVDGLVGYLAALSAGHVVLLVPAEPGAAVEGLTATYDPDVVVGPVAGRWDVTERRDGSAHDLHPELALLLSTSGSTGSPKLVRLSQRNLQANAESIAGYLGISGNDRAATTLPVHYCYGLSVVHSHLLRGASLILTEQSVLDPGFWERFRREGGTSFAGVPYTFDLLDRIGFADLDLPHLRTVTQAGGRLDPERVRRYAQLGRERGWELVVMYGQTEATARMAYLPPELAVERPTAVGVPVPGGSFALEPVPEAPAPEVGELVYSGPNVMLGYAESPADLALGRTVDRLATGDLARRGSDGLLEIVGRRSRFLKIVGRRIDLEQAEAFFARRGIAALCTGDDEELVVTHEPGVDAPSIGRLAAQEFGLPPSSVRTVVVPELPRTATGKPDHRAVAELVRRPAAPAARTPAPGAGEAAVLQLFADVLRRPDATPEDSFTDLGGDSLSYVEVSVRLGELLGTLPPGWHTTPVRDLVPAGRPRWGRPVETSVLLRAVATVLIVGTHIRLFDVLGGAHVLIALAGYNVARFNLTAAGRVQRRRSLLSSTARVVVPSVLWIGAALTLTDDYDPTNLVLLNSVLGPEDWTPTWHFWFIEVLVYLLLATAALLSLPWVDRCERRWPFAFPLALFCLGLLGRYGIFGDGLLHTEPVLWLFALGWAAARATTSGHRLLVSVLAVLTVPGFFDMPQREALIVAGLVALGWVPGIRCPAWLAAVAGVLASASLYVYLTHWQVYRHMSEDQPLQALLASLLVGTGCWALVTAGQRAVRRRRPLRPLRPAREAAVVGGPEPVGSRR